MSVLPLLSFQKNKKRPTAKSDEDDSDEITGTGHAPIKSGFACLELEDNDNDSDEGEDNESKTEVKVSQRKKKKQAKSNVQQTVEVNGMVDATDDKKKLGKKKGRMKDEEDIDAILEEFSLKDNTSAATKKDKGKKGGKAEKADTLEDHDKHDPPAVVESAPSLTIENRLMTQDEIAKQMEEMYPSSEDEKKAKKKKNKKQRDTNKDDASKDESKTDKAKPVAQQKVQGQKTGQEGLKTESGSQSSEQFTVQQKKEAAIKVRKLLFSQLC